MYSCKTDIIFEEQKYETRFIDAKADQQICGLTNKNAEPVNHEKSTLMNPFICKTGFIFDMQRNDTRFTDNRRAGERAARYRPESTHDGPHCCRHCRYIRQRHEGALDGQTALLHPRETRRQESDQVHAQWRRHRCRCHQGSNRKVDHLHLPGVFFLNFPAFLWFGRTAKDLDDETKTNTKKTENMLINPSGILCCKRMRLTIRSSMMEWTRSSMKASTTLSLRAGTKRQYT